MIRPQPVLILALALAAGLSATLPGAPEKHATVTGAQSESNLATVTLDASAAKRLGIATVAIARQPVSQDRLYGGEIVLATALDPAGDGQSIFALLPEMTASERLRLAESQIDADGAINLAQVRLDAAEQSLTRAQTLLTDKVGSLKAVEEATALRDLASQELDTARSRRALLGPPLLLTTPPASVWVKVPVYVGGLPDLDLQGDATLCPLNGRSGANPPTATPISAPPSAQPLTATVDLFYQTDNQDGTLRPGQRVGIRLPVKGETESLVVPWAAVLYDINGGAWVYLQTAPLTYSRHRIQVRRVEGDLAILATGPEPGALAVTDGAAELFGTEFGVPK